jgi:hypothetical protein
MERLLYGVVAFALAFYLMLGLGLAHDDAAWIQQNENAPPGGYVMKSGVHCCGTHDCQPMPQWAIDQLEPTGELDEEGRPTGYRLFHGAFMRGHRSFYQSIDLRWWWCRSPAYEQNVFCIFEPETGF